MRILVTSQPGLGHVNGTINLAQCMQAQGHSVLVVGAPSVVEAFGQAGVDGVPIVSEPLWSDAAETHKQVPALAAVDPVHHLTTLRAELGIRRRAFDLVEPLREVVQSWEPTVMLRDATELAAWVVAEQFDVPDVSFEVSVHWSRERWNAELAQPLVELRHHAGLLTDPGAPADTMYRYMHINNSPLALQDLQVRLPETSIDLSPVFFEDYPSEAVDPAATGHVYVAFGSVYQPDMRVIGDVVRRLADLFPSVLLAASMPGAPRGVVAQSYIPQTSAMNGCALVLCHGGRNTVLTALRHGVPLVCVPMGSDHFEIAELVQRAGAGISAKWDRNEVLAAVRQVSANAAFREAAGRVAKQIAMMGSAEQVIVEMQRRLS